MRLFTKKQEVKFSSAMSDDVTIEAMTDERRILKQREKPTRKFSIGLLSLILVISMCLGLTVGGYFAYKKYLEDQHGLQNAIQSNYTDIQSKFTDITAILDKQKSDTAAAAARLDSSITQTNKNLNDVKDNFAAYKNDAKYAYNKLQSSVYYVKGKGSYTSVYYTERVDWIGGRFQVIQIPHYNTVNFTQTGTGFLIAPDGILVTNQHVIEDLKIDNISVTNMAGKEFTNLELIGIDNNNDLAIIKVHGLENAPYLELSPLLNAEEYHNMVGAHTYTLGYPAGYIMFSDGLISSDLEYQSFENKPKVLVFKISNSMGLGSSGGPVMAEGKVIGVCVGKYVSNQVDNLNWALTTGPLYSLIRMISNKYPSLAVYSSN